MSDLPSFERPKDVPGKFTVTETGEKGNTGKHKVKIRIRKRMKTRTRIRKKNSRSILTKFLKVLQVILLIFAVVALFYAGYNIILADMKKPINIIQKK